MRSLAWAGCLLLSACSFQTEVPAGRTIACSATAACPTGYTCETTLGRCIADAALAAPAPALSNAALTPTTGNLQTAFALTFDVSTPLAQPPTAYATNFAGTSETYPFTCDPCGPGTSCTCAFTPSAASPPPAEGPLHVWVELVSAVGNAPPAFEVGTLNIDLTPPALAQPAQLTLAAPLGVTTPVTELGLGGSAQVCFQVDKTLGPVPAVWASGPDDAGALGFGLEGGFPLGLLYCYAAAVDGGGLDGTKSLQAVLQDVAGNVAQVLLIDLDGGLQVDTVPPAPPDTSVDGGLVYLRAPRGQLPDLTEPAFTLASAGPAIGKAGTLLVYADMGRAQFVASVAVAPGPLPALELPGPDRPTVYVDLVDAAGTFAPGGPFAVKNVRWVATLGGKIAGDALSNPHDCYARPILGPSLIQGDDVRTVQGAPALDGGLTVISGSASWRERFSGSPDTISDIGNTSTAAYDSARGEVIALVSDESAGSSESWAYTGDWFPVGANGASPPTRDAAGISYDAARGRMVLFGGSSIDEACDVWEWDGSTWLPTSTCVALPDAGPSVVGMPAPRDGAAQAYDPRRRRTVVLGGEDANEDSFADLWEYDGHTWTPLAIDAGFPGALTAATMSYAELGDGGGALVVEGGYRGATEDPTNATWFGQWNGVTYTWTRASGGITCGPTEPDCGPGSLANDATGAALSLATADEDSGSIRLWHWSGTHWVLAGPVAQSTSLGSLISLGGTWSGDAYVLLGQIAPGGELAAASWTCSASLRCQLTHTGLANIDAREAAALSFDSAGVGVLTGGDSSASPNASAAVYTWDGNDWQGPLTLGGVPPVGRIQPALIDNPAENRRWMAGGSDVTQSNWYNDIWALDLTTGWIPLGTFALDLDNEEAASLAYVPDAGMVLEGVTADPTLLLPNADGGLTSIDLGPSLDVGTMTYDPLVNGLVIEGANHGDVFVDRAPFDGGWSRIAAGQDQEEGRVFYDSTLGRVLVLGQVPSTTIQGDIWAVEGDALTRIPLADPEGDGTPVDENYSAVDFDPARGTLVLFGGHTVLGTSFVVLGDTWEFQQAPYQPALACLFRFGTAEVDPAATILGVDLAASGGSDSSGAQLEVWQGHTWRPVATCGTACGATSPQSLNFSASSPTEAAQLLYDLSTVGVAISSVEPNGGGLASIAAGPMQATVTYRLP